MAKASKPSTRKAAKGKVRNLKPATSAQIKGGRKEAQLNSGGVNPLVISRDRALGNG